MKRLKTVCLSVATLFYCLSPAAAQTGGDFAITQSVIASGGGQSSTGGNFAVGGTIGQSTAGKNLTGGNFAVNGGFWAANSLAPTAAQVSVSGRVRTANGNGIRNVYVTLTNLNNAVQTSFTGSFGYYRFENVTVGETYIITVYSKRFTFSQPTIVRTIFEEIADLDFVADSSQLSP